MDYLKGILVKKFLFLLGLCVLLLGLLPTLALATSVEGLTALATFFPADTVIFAAIRSDDDFIESVNNVLRRIERRTDNPIMTVQDILNQTISVNSGLTFEDNIRPWLGDTIAVGVQDFSARTGPSYVVAVSVTDSDLLAALLELGAMDSSSGEEYTQYDFPSTSVRLYGNVLVVSVRGDILDSFAEGDRLSDSEDFSATLELLPESDYNAIVYIQTAEIMAALPAQMEAANTRDVVTVFCSTDAAMQIFNQFSARGSQALGFTVVNEWGFAMDFVSRAAEGLNPELSPATDAAPLDFGFAANIPADAPLYVQDTNVGEDVRRAINLLALVFELGIDQSIADATASGEQVNQFMDSINRNDVRAFINLAFAGFTGLNLENDVLANLNGNTGIYLRFLSDEVGPFTTDGAIVAEMDGDASERIFNSLNDALTQYEADFSVDDQVITLRLPMPTPEDPTIDVAVHPTMDLLLGYNDDVFVVGTRSAAEYSLNPDGDSLADTEEFSAAQAYFLPDAETLLYIDLNFLVPFIDDNLMSNQSQYGNDALKALSLFTSASITSRVDDDGTAAGRAVITLRPE